MWNTLKRIGEVLGILTVPRLRERHVVRLSKALDQAVNEVERLQAELGIKQQEGWQDYEAAATTINDLSAQLAQAEIELADKAFYVREFAAVSQERDDLKAQLSAPPVGDHPHSDADAIAARAVAELEANGIAGLTTHMAVRRVVAITTEAAKAEIADLRERAEQAEAERDDLNDETRIILELRDILGLKPGESITMRCKQLAAHAVIDVPAGVPSVEELIGVARNARPDYAIDSAQVVAIRDAVLAGRAQPSSNAVQLPADEVEALKGNS